jgi:23S rRNA pseudouridine2605 synthase
VRVVYDYDREYRVLVARRPDEGQLETWRRGVVLEDGYRTRPADVRVESNFGKGTWLRVVLKEGRKLQIRETGSQVGLPVVKIIPVRIGSLQIGTLKPREWRHLTVAEVAALKGQPNIPQSRPTKTGFKPRKSGSKPKKGGEPSRPRRTPERGKQR